MKLDILLIGPAHPYRGGIAETQHEFANALQNHSKKVLLWTFSHLYPNLLFKGESQFATQNVEFNLNIYRRIHAYNPQNWKNQAQEINSMNPSIIVFRYYTPFLAFSYTQILKHLNSEMKKVGLIDNWIPHEKRIVDGLLNKNFSKRIDLFTCLSENVARQISSDVRGKPIWSKNHPISSNLPPKLGKQQSRLHLGWDLDKKIVLFFGIIRPYKGLDTLIHAFSESPLFQTGIKLKVVGDCYENRTKYVRLVRKLQIGTQVDLDFRYANRAKIQLVFSAADLVVLPYRSATQSGIISMAYHYECPLVVTEVDGLKEIVHQDKTGLISPADSSVLAEKIQVGLEEENLKNFRQKIRESTSLNSWDSFTSSWLKFVLG